MKHVVLTIAVAALTALFYSPTFAQSCSPTGVTGCVGECGSSQTDSYTAPGNPNQTRTYTLEATSSNLCGNTGAAVDVAFPGLRRPNVSGDLTQGPVTWSVSGGQEMIITVSTFDNKSGILCVRLGELNYELCRNH